MLANLLISHFTISGTFDPILSVCVVCGGYLRQREYHMGEGYSAKNTVVLPFREGSHIYHNSDLQAGIWFVAPSPIFTFRHALVVLA